jgi:hypothetical protein
VADKGVARRGGSPEAVLLRAHLREEQLVREGRGRGGRAGRRDRGDRVARGGGGGGKGGGACGACGRRRRRRRRRSRPLAHDDAHPHPRDRRLRDGALEEQLGERRLQDGDRRRVREEDCGAAREGRAVRTPAEEGSVGCGGRGRVAARRRPEGSGEEVGPAHRGADDADLPRPRGLGEGEGEAAEGLVGAADVAAARGRARGPRHRLALEEPRDEGGVVALVLAPRRARPRGLGEGDGRGGGGCGGCGDNGPRRGLLDVVGGAPFARGCLHRCRRRRRRRRRRLLSRVGVLVQHVQEVVEELVRVLLLARRKVGPVRPDDAAEGLGRDDPEGSAPELPHEVGVGVRHLPARPRGVARVEHPAVGAGDKVGRELRDGAEALDRAVLVAVDGKRVREAGAPGLRGLPGHAGVATEGGGEGEGGGGGGGGGGAPQPPGAPAAAGGGAALGPLLPAPQPPVEVEAQDGDEDKEGDADEEGEGDDDDGRVEAEGGRGGDGAEEAGGEEAEEDDEEDGAEPRGLRVGEAEEAAGEGGEAAEEAEGEGRRSDGARAVLLGGEGERGRSRGPPPLRRGRRRRGC